MLGISLTLSGVVLGLAKHVLLKQEGTGSRGGNEAHILELRHSIVEIGSHHLIKASVIHIVCKSLHKVIVLLVNFSKSVKNLDQIDIPSKVHHELQSNCQIVSLSQILIHALKLIATFFHQLIDCFLLRSLYFIKYGGLLLV